MGLNNLQPKNEFLKKLKYKLKTDYYGTSPDRFNT
jgi:hypothetical protein